MRGLARGRWTPRESALRPAHPSRPAHTLTNMTSSGATLMPSYMCSANGLMLQSVKEETRRWCWMHAQAGPRRPRTQLSSRLPQLRGAQRTLRCSPRTRGRASRRPGTAAAGCRCCSPRPAPPRCCPARRTCRLGGWEVGREEAVCWHSAGRKQAGGRGGTAQASRLLPSPAAGTAQQPQQQRPPAEAPYQMASCMSL